MQKQKKKISLLPKTVEMYTTLALRANIVIVSYNGDLSESSI